MGCQQSVPVITSADIFRGGIQDLELALQQLETCEAHLQDLEGLENDEAAASSKPRSKRRRVPAQSAVMEATQSLRVFLESWKAATKVIYLRANHLQDACQSELARPGSVPFSKKTILENKKPLTNSNSTKTESQQQQQHVDSIQSAAESLSNDTSLPQTAVKDFLKALQKEIQQREQKGWSASTTGVIVSGLLVTGVVVLVCVDFFSTGGLATALHSITSGTAAATASTTTAATTAASTTTAATATATTTAASTAAAATTTASSTTAAASVAGTSTAASSGAVATGTAATSSITSGTTAAVTAGTGLSATTTTTAGTAATGISVALGASVVSAIQRLLVQETMDRMMQFLRQAFQQALNGDAAYDNERTKLLLTQACQSGLQATLTCRQAAAQVQQAHERLSQYARAIVLSVEESSEVSPPVVSQSAMMEFAQEWKSLHRSNHSKKWTVPSFLESSEETEKGIPIATAIAVR